MFWKMNKKENIDRQEEIKPLKLKKCIGIAGDKINSFMLDSGHVYTHEKNEEFVLVNGVNYKEWISIRRMIGGESIEYSRYNIDHVTYIKWEDPIKDEIGDEEL